MRKAHNPEVAWFKSRPRYFLKMLYIGIDEAGRGPVIGPMIIAGILADRKQLDALKKLGVKDSKMLSPARREYLFEKIKNNAIDFGVAKILPEEIDSKISQKINLNKIEAINAAKIINELAKNTNEQISLFVDCPSVNISAWQSYLFQHLEKKEKIIPRCEHKADVNYPIVSAASIIAKVTRDREIEKIKKIINEDFGSGYPSDPATINFLKKRAKKYENMGIIRKSWATWTRREKKQKKLDEF